MTIKDRGGSVHLTPQEILQHFDSLQMRIEELLSENHENGVLIEEHRELFKEVTFALLQAKIICKQNLTKSVASNTEFRKTLFKLMHAVLRALLTDENLDEFYDALQEVVRYLHSL